MWRTTVRIICSGEVVFGAAFQSRCRSTRYGVRRAAFFLAAVAAGVYAASNLLAARQLFLLRTFDVGTMMSPLLVLGLFGAVPVIPACAELWRLRAFGANVPDGREVPDRWERSHRSVATWAGVTLSGLDGLEHALVGSHTSLLDLPWRWMTVSVVTTAFAGAIVFDTTTGRMAWNWEFMSKVLVYVGIPLLTLFATQFPDIGSSLLRLLEPVQRLPGQ
jgi:hypothetical protein